MEMNSTQQRRFRATLAGALREDIDAHDLIDAFRIMVERYPHLPAIGKYRVAGDRVAGQFGAVEFKIEEVAR